MNNRLTWMVPDARVSYKTESRLFFHVMLVYRQGDNLSPILFSLFLNFFFFNSEYKYNLFKSISDEIDTANGIGLLHSDIWMTLKFSTPIYQWINLEYINWSYFYKHTTSSLLRDLFGYNLIRWVAKLICDRLLSFGYYVICRHIMILI